MISKLQLGCVVAAVVGILVSMVPVALPSPPDGDTEYHTTIVGHILWPVMTAIAHLCSALDFVLIEIILDVKKVQYCLDIFTDLQSAVCSFGLFFFFFFFG